MKLKRDIKFLMQRIVRGWDDSETWSLDVPISEFIYPRLERFKLLNNGFPDGITENEWDEILDKMIYSFKLISDRFCDSGAGERMLMENIDKIEEGLDLFRKYFFHLWW